jgi:tetratricopeptide (TPR) repeat protein
MMGEVDARVSAWVEIARQRVAEGDIDRAIELFSRALSLDPERLEVHIDLAELEIARGHTRAAMRRLEAVAEAYVDAGNAEAAADVLEFAAALGSGKPLQPGVVQRMQTGRTEPMGILLPTPRQRPREETVLARTILLFPDGTPMPPQPTSDASNDAAKAKPTKRPPAPTRARFRVSPPPMLRRPR